MILGATYPIFDTLFDVNPDQRAPRAPAILTCISYFCLQYYSSGLLSANGVDGVALHGFLAVTAVACWYTWDRTPTGAVMCVTTGVAGPGVEIGLLQAYPALTGAELYHYNNPDILGIPLWIAWVYACGAPAVGNLARAVWRAVKTADGGGAGDQDVKV
ncbi:INSIG family protein [bacterium]|nr:INSIG family protein [bacterium]